MITSRKNSHLKIIRRLRRSKGDRALLEGPHLIAEALTSGCGLSSILATPDFLASEAGRRLVATLPQRPLATDPRLLEEIADSDSPRGIVAVAQLGRPSLAELPLVDTGVYLYTDGVQDPGNLGALARVAEASGAVALCTSPETVAANHPRALRASAGSLLRLPVVESLGPVALSEHLAPTRPRWLALVPRDGADLYTTPLDGTFILALGAEGRGLSDEAQELAEVRLTIPLCAPVESLNVTVAGAVTLFELRRRRLSAHSSA